MGGNVSDEGQYNHGEEGKYLNIYQHDKSDSSSKNRFLFHHLRHSYETVRPV